MDRKKKSVLSCIVIVLGVVLFVLLCVAMGSALRGCSAQTTETTETTIGVATPTPTPTPTPSISEEDASSYTDEQLLLIYGQPREFKRTSTKIDVEPRVEATKIFDAVTYIVSPEGLDGICEEILANPIYLTGVDQALREVKIVGQSDWANKFKASYEPVTTEWWEQWIEKDATTGKWYVTKEYHLIAARYCCIVKGLQYLREIDKAKVRVHWPLNVEMEVCYRSENDEKYPFWVYRFIFKDGREIYIGINKIDYRWAIIPPVPTPTPTSTVTPTPPPSTPTPTTTPPPSTPTPTPTTTKPKNRDQDPVIRNTDPSAAADIGTPSDPGNHNNQVDETPEPTSPSSYTNQVTPTPEPTKAPTAAPTAVPTTPPKPTSTPKPTSPPANRGSGGQSTPRTTPSVEPGVADDGINHGDADYGDPDDK